MLHSSIPLNGSTVGLIFGFRHTGHVVVVVVGHTKEDCAIRREILMLHLGFPKPLRLLFQSFLWIGLGRVDSGLASPWLLEGAPEGFFSSQE